MSFVRVNTRHAGWKNRIGVRMTHDRKNGIRVYIRALAVKVMGLTSEDRLDLEVDLETREARIVRSIDGAKLGKNPMFWITVDNRDEIFPVESWDSAASVRDGCLYFKLPPLPESRLAALAEPASTNGNH